MNKDQIREIEKAEDAFNRALNGWMNPRQYPEHDLNALEAAREKLVSLIKEATHEGVNNG